MVDERELKGWRGRGKERGKREKGGEGRRDEITSRGKL